MTHSRAALTDFRQLVPVGGNELRITWYSGWSPHDAAANGHPFPPQAIHAVGDRLHAWLASRCMRAFHALAAAPDSISIRLAVDAIHGKKSVELPAYYAVELSP